MEKSSSNALRRERTASGKPACAPHIRRKSASIESQQARAPAQTEITPNANSAKVVPLSLKPVTTELDEDIEFLTDTTPAYWAKRINRRVEKSAHAFVELGQVLRSAKAKLKHGLWLKMFKTGQVKLGLSLAQRLIKIAANPAMTNAANLPFLPPSPTALVSLSKLPPEVVDAGIAAGYVCPGMTITTAAKFVAEHRPEALSDNGNEPKSTTTPGDAAKDFIVVLWDDTDAAPDKLSRAPAKTYSAKNNPNLVSLRLSPQGVVRFDGRTVDGLAELAVFAVELEPSATEPKEIPLIKDKRGTPFCQQTIQFLTLAVRGVVPKPAIFPSQIIPGGYDGVIKMISAMYPTALKVVSTTREQFPPGWEYVPRDKKVGADAALANEQAAAPLADVPKPPAEVPVPKAERGPAMATESTDAADAKEAEVHNREKAAFAGKTPAKTAKIQARRKTRPTTVRDHLSKLLHGLASVAEETGKSIENWPKNNYVSTRYQAMKREFPSLVAVKAQLAQLIASFALPNEKNHAGELPFLRKYALRGLRSTRVPTIRLTILEIAESIQKSAPETAQYLKTMCKELERICFARGV